VPSCDQISELIEQLKDENGRLRDTALSLSLTLLRTAAVHTVQNHNATMADVHNLVRLAEECFDSAGMPGLKPQIAEGLQAAGHELMAKAVEVHTRLQREKRDKE
jgi:hypothetical protein